MSIPTNNDSNFVKLQNKRLIRFLTQDWKRISSRMLYISDDTSYLDLFWRAGFDISHLLDRSKSYEQYHNMLGPKVEIVQGYKHAIPYADESFDYVSVLYCYQDLHSFQAILKEAFRLATKGVIIVDWNKNSLAGYKHNATRPKDILNSIKKNIEKPEIKVFSSLLCPSSTWQHQSKFKQLNKAILPFHFGAIIGYKINLIQLAPITKPLFAKNTATAPIHVSSPSASPVMSGTKFSKPNLSELSKNDE